MLGELKIIGVLRDELRLQSRYCRLLEQQQEALLACDRARFSILQAEQAQMLGQLEMQDQARRAALTTPDGPVTIASIIKAAEGQSQRILSQLRGDLGRLLERVQALSHQNEQLLQNELDYIAFTLDLVVEAGRKGDSPYGGGVALAGRMGLDRRA